MQRYRGGAFIEHGFSTIISCAKMGGKSNCMINQQVTIGWKSIIGNNVKIRDRGFQRRPGCDK